MQIIEVAAALRFKSGAVLQQALVTFDEHAHPGFFTRSMWRISSGTSGPYVGSKRRFQIPPDRDYHRAFFEMAQHANDGAVYLRVSGERPHYRITKRIRGSRGSCTPTTRSSSVRGWPIAMAAGQA